ncbi:hypothetical protein GCM10010428_45570 [Actinosynnema pretiosum subsp. pretiosum]
MGSLAACGAAVTAGPSGSCPAKGLGATATDTDPLGHQRAVLRAADIAEVLDEYATSPGREAGVDLRADARLVLPPAVEREVRGAAAVPALLPPCPAGQPRDGRLHRVRDERPRAPGDTSASSPRMWT